MQYPNRNPNWPITDSETPFQRENLVFESMGYCFHKKGPLKPNLLLNIKYDRLFLKIWVYFQAKIYYFQMWETREKLKRFKIFYKQSFGFWKKTEI